MWLETILLLFWKLNYALPCRPGFRPGPGGMNKTLFSNDSAWGTWSPPAGDNSWKEWIIKWGVTNNSAVDSTEEGRGQESGWPSYWKNLGLSNKGVPPPPWALVPLSYGKPQYCFLQPAPGNCDYNLIRWAYNPTKNQCQIFKYTGCGRNQNNFILKQDCIRACVEPPSTDCEEQAQIKLEEFNFKNRRRCTINKFR